MNIASLARAAVVVAPWAFATAALATPADEKNPAAQPSSPGVDELPYSDHHVVNACFARASFALKRGGAISVSAPQRLGSEKLDNGWRVTGRLVALMDDKSQGFLVDCVLVHGGINVEVTMRPDGA
jgi:hypothetical protein